MKDNTARPTAHLRVYTYFILQKYHILQAYQVYNTTAPSSSPTHRTLPQAGLDAGAGGGAQADEAEDPAMAPVLAALAEVYVCQGKYAQAEPLLQVRRHRVHRGRAPLVGEKSIERPSPSCGQGKAEPLLQVRRGRTPLIGAAWGGGDSACRRPPVAHPPPAPSRLSTPCHRLHHP